MAFASWLSDVVDIYKSIHPGYETTVVPGNEIKEIGHNKFSVGSPRTPKEAAKDEGAGYKPGYFSGNDPSGEFADLGYVRLHRKK